MAQNRPNISIISVAVSPPKYLKNYCDNPTWGNLGPSPKKYVCVLMLRLQVARTACGIGSAAPTLPPLSCPHKARRGSRPRRTHPTHDRHTVQTDTRSVALTLRTTQSGPGPAAKHPRVGSCNTTRSGASHAVALGGLPHERHQAQQSLGPTHAFSTRRTHTPRD